MIKSALHYTIDSELSNNNKQILSLSDSRNNMSYKFEPANIRNLDRRPSTFTLSFDSQAHHKSMVGGCLSICYMLMVVAIVVFKFLDLQNRQHVNFEILVNKSNDVYPLDINGANLTLVLYKYIDGISRQTIKPSEQYKYGINVTILEYTLYQAEQDGEIVQKQRHLKLSMVPCDATESEKISYFCLPKNSGMDYNILGRTDFSRLYNEDRIGYKRYSILVEQCSKDASPLCNDYSQKLFPFVRFYNNAIEQQVPSHNDTVLFQSTKRAFQPLTQYLDTSYQVRLILYMKRVIVETYTSLLPDFFEDTSPLVTRTYFYDEESKEQSFLTSTSAANSSVLFQAQFRRSVFTNLYRRQYKRVDEMLAEVFGLVGLLGLVVFGLYAGYNGWCFEQSIRKYFNLPYTKPTILKYYSFKIRSILYKFCGCYFRNQSQFKKQVQTQQKLREILDYKNCILSFEIVRASAQASARSSGERSNNTNRMNGSSDGVSELMLS